MDIIRHVQQPTDSSCVLACVAMVSGLELSTVIQVAENTFHHDPLAHGLSCAEKVKLLDTLGIGFTHVWPIQLTFLNVYVVAVPSLNIKAAMHEVIFDMRDEYEVLDPNLGRSGKEVYDRDTIRGYAEVLRIHGSWQTEGER